MLVSLGDFKAQVLSFRVFGVRFDFEGSGFKVLTAQGLRSKVQVLICRVWGVGSLNLTLLF